VADILFRKGVSAPPILHPAVPERRARLRLFASSEHTPAQIDRAAAMVAEAVAEAPGVVGRLFGRGFAPLSGNGDHQTIVPASPPDHDHGKSMEGSRSPIPPGRRAM
jgi:hypothetical protein